MIVVHIIRKQSPVSHNFQNLLQIARAYPSLVDSVRLDKAMQIASDPYRMAEAQDKYEPSVSGCGCEDWANRAEPRRKSADGNQYSGPCKHMLAQVLWQD